MTVAFAPVSFFASATVSKTGRPAQGQARQGLMPARARH